jgi:CRISPR/Cas system-associated protein Cas10 (large subunit of type III CRISPR-Cas system)
MGLLNKIKHRIDKIDSWYKCTICGREGHVGRCCGDETRIPLNKLARKKKDER